MLFDLTERQRLEVQLEQRALTDPLTCLLIDMDRFARIGGEEFACLLPETTVEQAGEPDECLPSAS